MKDLEENKIYDKLNVNGVCFENVSIVITDYSLEILKDGKFISNFPIDYINKVSFSEGG